MAPEIKAKFKTKIMQSFCSKVWSSVPFVFYNYSQAGLSLLISILLANALGSEGFGIYSFGLVFATGLPMIVGFAEDRTLVRDLIQCGNASGVLTASILIRFLLSSIAMMGISVWLIVDTKESTVCWTVLICSLCGVLLGLTPRAWFDHRYEMARHAFLVLGERGLFGMLLLLTFIGDIGSKNAVTVAFFLLVSLIVSVSLQWLHVFKTFEVVFRGIGQYIKLLFKENFLIWVGVLGNLLMTHCNRIILTKKMGPSEMAYYGLSIQFVIVIQLLQYQILRFLTPSIAKITMPGSSPQEMKSKFFKYVGLSLGLTCIIIVPVFFVVPFVIKAFMKSEFQEAIPSFYVLLIWTTIYGAALINNQFLICLRLNRAFVAITLIFGMASIFLAYEWIPLFGAMGAALSLLTSHLGSIICQFICVSLRLRTATPKTITEPYG